MWGRRLIPILIKQSLKCKIKIYTIPLINDQMKTKLVMHFINIGKVTVHKAKFALLQQRKNARYCLQPNDISDPSSQEFAIKLYSQIMLNLNFAKILHNSWSIRMSCKQELNWEQLQRISEIEFLPTMKEFCSAKCTYFPQTC